MDYQLPTPFTPPVLTSAHPLCPGLGLELTMDDRLRWKPGSGGSGGDVEAAGSTAVIRPRSKGPAGAAAGGMGSKVRGTGAAVGGMRSKVSRGGGSRAHSFGALYGLLLLLSLCSPHYGLPPTPFSPPYLFRSLAQSRCACG